MLPTTDMEERKAFAGLNDDIAAAVDSLQLFGTVDGKNLQRWAM